MPQLNSNRLTSRQQEVLNFIVLQLNQKGYPPSIREIGKKTNITSLRGVTLQLDALKQMGYIKRNSLARGITALKPEQANNNLNRLNSE